MKDEIVKAEIVSMLAHKGQRYGESDYFHGHIMEVVMNVKADPFFNSRTDFDREVAIASAFLHDTIEDTFLTVDHLLALGFTTPVVATVECLTRRPDETYRDFIERPACDYIAARVKIADIQANLAAPPIRASLTARYERALIRLGA